MPGGLRSVIISGVDAVSAFAAFKILILSISYDISNHLIRFLRFDPLAMPDDSRYVNLPNTKPRRLFT
jgi:hypothetical protein